MRTLSDIEIQIINSNRTAKTTDRYLDSNGNVWVGTNFGRLILPPMSDQIINSVDNSQDINQMFDAVNEAIAGKMDIPIKYTITSSATISGPGIYLCFGSLTLTLSAANLRSSDKIQIYNMNGERLVISGGGIQIQYAVNGRSAQMVSTKKLQSFTLQYDVTSYLVE